MITITNILQPNANNQIKFKEVDDNLTILDGEVTTLSATKANISGGNNFIGNQDVSGSLTADKIISPIYQGGAGEPYGKVSIPQTQTKTVFEVSSTEYSSIIVDAYVLSKTYPQYYAVQNVYLTWEPNNLENINLSVAIPISSPSASGDPTTIPATPPSFGKDSLIYSTQVVAGNIQLQVQNSTNPPLDELVYTSIVRAFTTTG